MTLEQIFEKETAREKIDELKQGRHAEMPDVDGAKKALDPALHDINSPSLRPNKSVKIPNPENENLRDGEEPKPDITKPVPVARIALALQKLIIKRAVAFLFGNPVNYNSTPEKNNKGQELALKAMKRILHNAKSNSINRKLARAIFGFKECAELWYPVPVDKTRTGRKLIDKIADFVNNVIGNKYHIEYGFKSAYKLRCMLLSPAFGDKLYPYFDETDDMIAFSREFSRKEKDSGEGPAKDVLYFETYTAEEHWLWRQSKEQWEVVDTYPKKNPIGKIPIIFSHQEEFETQDVNSLIDRLETLLSNFADTNDYHASPKIVIKGELKGFAQKGESGAILELEGDDANASYLSWQHAPESVKLEIDTLLRMIYTITQTPDIAFDSVRGIGAISGVALKLLFMDPHLKVQDKREIFDEHLQRRVNVIKAFIGKMHVAIEQDSRDLEVEPEITPYIITSEIDEVKLWTEANGGKPLISHKQSVRAANLSQDTEADWDEIQRQSQIEVIQDIFEPTE